MRQKVHPIRFRLGISQRFCLYWYVNKIYYYYFLGIWKSVEDIAAQRKAMIDDIYKVK